MSSTLIKQYLFHGTNRKLLDSGLVAGTFFTDDLEIALKYGKTIYVFALNDGKTDLKEMFEYTWDDHYVSRMFIPLEFLTKLIVGERL